MVIQKSIYNPVKVDFWIKDNVLAMGTQCLETEVI